MKVILSYGNYFSYGKQYQAKFIYENIEEAKQINSWLKSKKNKLLIKPYQEVISLAESKYNKTTIKTNVIKVTNIPKNELLTFINELIIQQKATIVLGDKEFTNLDFNITEAIKKLHININLKKGDYFGIKDTYYVIFKYASDEQRNEVYYDFNMHLYPLIGNNIENGCYIFPIIIDKNGKITNENTGIIGGTNIPNQALSFFLQRFINEYNAIINIENSLQEHKIDNIILSKQLSKQNHNKIRILNQTKGV